MCRKHSFHSLNILLLLETCENIQIILRFYQRPTTAQDVSPQTPPLPSFGQAMEDGANSSKGRGTHSVSSTFLCCFRWSMTAFISRRASDSVKVGTFWNSPSLRSAVASSSPCGCSRVRDVGAVADILSDCYDVAGVYGRYASPTTIVSLWCKRCWFARVDLQFYL